MEVIQNTTKRTPEFVLVNIQALYALWGSLIMGHGLYDPNVNLKYDYVSRQWEKLHKQLFSYVGLNQPALHQETAHFVFLG